jgi:hypothetical protein
MSGAGREAVLRAYLLGALSPEAQEPIDQEVVEDPAAHEEMLAAQDDLIHAYLAGSLSAEDRERFESHFLASRRRRERVDFIRSLLTAVARENASARQAPGAPRSRRLTTALPWAAAVAIGLAGGAWSVVERQRADRAIASAQQRESAQAATIAQQRERIDALESRAASPPSSDITTWPLKRGRLRAPGVTETHEARRDGWIRLSVPIAPEQRSASFVASLQTPEGKELERVPGLVVDGPQGAVVEAIVPARRMPRGTYVLSLQYGRDAELPIPISVR